MITLTKICKKYLHTKKPTIALDELDLQVEKGEIFGVVGESGAGKSTLIRCVNFLEQPDSGTVVVNGKNLAELSKKQLQLARREIGMIFQHFNLLANRDAFANVALPLELAGWNKKDINKKVAELLDLVGLFDKKNHYPAQLSGGQKQRVAIARALALNPPILLSDEATSALDPKTTENTLSLLQDIHKQLGITILLITHEMEVVKQICHKVALISKGKNIESNEVGKFFTNPVSDLAKKFVAQTRKFTLPSDLIIKPQGKSPIIKLIFTDKQLNHPLISQISRDFSVDISILSAKIDHIASQSQGLLVAKMIGDQEKINQAINYLNQTVECEVLGYAE